MNEQAPSSRDWVGWIVVAWVVVCALAYYQMAMVPRFPWLPGMM